MRAWEGATAGTALACIMLSASVVCAWAGPAAADDPGSSGDAPGTSVQVPPEGQPSTTPERAVDASDAARKDRGEQLQKTTPARAMPGKHPGEEKQAPGPGPRTPNRPKPTPPKDKGPETKTPRKEPAPTPTREPQRMGPRRAPAQHPTQTPRGPGDNASQAERSATQPEVRYEPSQTQTARAKSTPQPEHSPDMPSEPPTAASRRPSAASTKVPTSPKASSASPSPQATSQLPTAPAKPDGHSDAVPATPPVAETTPPVPEPTVEPSPSTSHEPSESPSPSPSPSPSSSPSRAMQAVEKSETPGPLPEHRVVAAIKADDDVAAWIIGSVGVVAIAGTATAAGLTSAFGGLRPPGSSERR